MLLDDFFRDTKFLEGVHALVRFSRASLLDGLDRLCEVDISEAEVSNVAQMNDLSLVVCCTIEALRPAILLVITLWRP